MDTSSPNDSDTEARDQQLVQYQQPKEEFSPQFLELLDAERETSPNAEGASSQVCTAGQDALVRAGRWAWDGLSRFNFKAACEHEHICMHSP